MAKLECKKPDNGKMKKFIDSYSADAAELEVLTSKPVSFLILGKRKCGKTTVARYLSQDWGAKLITEIELIENELADANSAYGDEIRATLQSGTSFLPSLTLKTRISILGPCTSSFTAVELVIVLIFALKTQTKEALSEKIHSRSYT